MKNKVTKYLAVALSLAGCFLAYADGILTIHSNSSGGNSSVNTSGHTWIEYTNLDTGETHTYGTWGNNPGGLGNGLHTDLESNFSSDVSRSTYVNDASESSLMGTIASYQSQGADAWGYFNPCSGFATDAWNSATQSSDHLSDGFISTPANVKDSIMDANGGQANGDTSYMWDNWWEWI